VTRRLLYDLTCAQHRSCVDGGVSTRVYRITDDNATWR